MRSIAAWRTLLPEARRCLLTHPNVIGVGLGLRAAVGSAESLVWRVYVTRKIPSSELPVGAAVPKSLLGLTTDILGAQTGRPTAKEPPVYKAGMQIEGKVPASLPGSILQPGPSAQGVLTCFARDQANKPVLLSCSHIIFPSFIAMPHLGIYQPDYSSCCSGGDKIATPVFDKNKQAQPDGAGGWIGGYKDGKWFGGFNAKPGQIRINGAKVPGQGSDTDCAIARLDPGVKFHNVWPDGTVIKGAVTTGLGVGKGPPFGTAPTEEQYVRIYSPRLGKVIYGTMLSHHDDQFNVPDPDKIVYPFIISNSDDESAGIKPTIDQFIILPRPAPGEQYDPFRSLSFRGGDSGALVINHENRVIGIISRAYDVNKLYKDKAIEIATVELVGIANVIGFVLGRLNLQIPDDEHGWSGTAPSGGPATRAFVAELPVNPELAAQKRGAERLRQGLRASRRGKLLLGKIAQHRQEVRRLFATVRAIGAAWRDLNGPAFYHHCVRSARDPGHVIPISINGVTRARLAEVLVPLVARHASPALCRDIERHRVWLADALLPISTLDDVPEMLARRRQPV